MNHIENARLELLHQLQRDVQHERRRLSRGIIARIAIALAMWALAMWAGIVVAVVALT